MINIWAKITNVSHHAGNRINGGSRKGCPSFDVYISLLPGFDGAIIFEMTNPEPTAQDVTLQARRLLRQGAAQDASVTRRGKVLLPLPVLTPQHALESWFVGVAVGDRLAGFFQFSPDLVLRRYSAFLSRPDALDTCPLAAAWVDPETVRARAQALLQLGEEAGTPYLSYDQSPDRLAWAVPITASSGVQRLLYVAGDYAYPASTD